MRYLLYSGATRLASAATVPARPWMAPAWLGAKSRLLVRDAQAAAGIPRARASAPHAITAS